MTKFIFKRDKIRLLIWVLTLVLFDMMVLPSMNTMYPDQAARDSFRLVLENPAMIAMFGKGYGLENYTFGAFYAHMMYLWLGLFNGVMAIMIVPKYLRGDEEEGRYEMIRSLPVGRNSNLLASMIVIIITFTSFIIFKFLSLIVLGIETIDFAGTLNYSIGLGLIGILFAMIVAAISQMYQSNRTVMGVSFFVFLGLYIMFSIGILSSKVLLWLSPFQWLLHSQPFVNNIYWPLMIIILVSIVLAILALYLSSKRDLDAGLFKQKTKAHKTKEYIKRPFGFALRLNKTMIIGWLVACLILGASYGSIFGDLESFLAGNEMLANILPPDSEYPAAVIFMGVIVMVMGISSTIPAVLVMNKVATEEKKGRMEIIFSHPVSKKEIACSYFKIALITGILAMFVSALGLYLASSTVMDDNIAFSIMLKAIMVYIPSLILLLGLSLLLTGLIPTKIWIVWLYIGLGFFVVYIGQILGLSETITKLTPFGYAPQIPVDEMNWITQIIITFVGLVLGYLGLIKYQKRNSL
jgi:ABC-2 type transport system permease protein